MAIQRTNIVDDDGSGQTGTVIDNAWKQEFYDQIDGAIGALSAETEILNLGGAYTYNNLPLDPAKRVHYLVLGGAAPTSGDCGISGLANGKSGDIAIINNYLSSGTVSLHHRRTDLSAAGNLLINLAGSGPTVLAAGVPGDHPGGAATYFYDATNWRLMSHEQGAWMTLPYVASNFTANVGTWTVEAGQTFCRYLLRGRTLQVIITIQQSDISGASPVQLGIAGWPYQFDAATLLEYGSGFYYAGSGWQVAKCAGQTGLTQIVIQKMDETAFAPGTDSYYFSFRVFLDVR